MSRCDGILLVDKPAGLTSFKVVAKVREALVRSIPGLAKSGHLQRRGRYRFKCGHAGSLDPLATGLLVLMCGKGTRLSPYLMGLDKSYVASIRFGIGTDTLDAEGPVTGIRPVTTSVMDLTAALADFRGQVMQVPPKFSAIKRNGRPLYERARRGEEIPPLAAKSITISKIEITGSRWGEIVPTGESKGSDDRIYEATLDIACSSGTYVRAIARDLATALGTLGYVHALRRERVGPFQVAEAVAAGRIEDPELLTANIRPLSDSLPHLPSMTVTQVEAQSLRQGGQPEIGWLDRLDRPLPVDEDTDLLFRIIDPAGHLVAVGKTSAKEDKPRTAAVFPDLSEEIGQCG